MFPSLLGLDRTYGLVSTLRGAMWLIASNAFRSAHRNESVLDEHSAIVDAIEAHDAKRAIEAVHDHLCRTLEAVKQSWTDTEPTSR